MKQAGNPSTMWGFALIVLGIVSIAVPFATAVALSLIVSWILAIAGVVHLISAFQHRDSGNLLWRALVAVAYLAVAAFLMTDPLMLVATITLWLAVAFIAEAIFEIVLYWRMRTSPNSMWLLINGLVTLALGLMIWSHWPDSSTWVIGTLVGISLLTSGITRVMMAKSEAPATEAAA